VKKSDPQTDRQMHLRLRQKVQRLLRKAQEEIVKNENTPLNRRGVFYCRITDGLLVGSNTQTKFPTFAGQGNLDRL
jgi:hypothetical protein